MAGIYDTHAHLNDTLYLEQDITPADIVKEARLAGVDIINVVGYDIKSSKLAIRLANQYPHVYAVVGIHPREAYLYNQEAINQIAELANADNVVGIGEIGLDYSKTTDQKEIQKTIFSELIKVAQNSNLPIVVHIKDKDGNDEAYKDAIEILTKHHVKKAVIHAFEGSLKMAQQIIELGYCLSFSGKITYNDNGELAEVIKKVSLNKMMIESDCPYASPVPFKGKINFPKNVPLVAKKIAEIKNTDIDNIISSTRIVAQSFFNVLD